MNSTKNKLFAAIAMLVVAAIAMTGTSFAWFTISTAPAVSNLEVKMSATRNFEIASIVGAPSTASAPDEPAIGDSNDETKWGASVSFSEANVVAFPAVMDGTALKTVTYGPTGRVAQLTGASLGTFTSGAAFYTADINATGSGEPVMVTCGAVYGVWLRANTAVTCKVSMSAFTVKTLGDAELSGDSKTRADASATVSAVFVNTKTNAETAVSAGSTLVLDANVPYKVLITVYFDGTNLRAEDVANGLKISDFDIEFVDSDGSAYLGTGPADSSDVPLMTF